MALGELTRRLVTAVPSLRLIALLATAHIGFTGMRLTLQLDAVRLGASPSTVGVLMSLMMVVPMFVAVPIGRWADRAGHTPPAMTGVMVLFFAGALASMWPSLWALGIASVCVGSGYMLAHVSINNGIGLASTPETRAHAFGAMAMAFSISGLVGPMLAGFVIDGAGQAVAFGVLTLFPILAALLLLLGRREPRGMRQAPAAERPAPGRMMDLLRHASLRAVFIVTGLTTLGWDLFTFLVPLQGVHVGLSASQIGLVVGAFGAGSFAARAAIPALMRKYDEWTVLRGSLALTAACYLVFPFCESLFTLLPLGFLLGAVLGCGQPVGMSLVHHAAPADRTGEAVGMRSTVTSVSQTVLPLLFGLMGSAVGMVPVFWVVAAVLGGGSAYARSHGPR